MSLPSIAIASRDDNRAAPWLTGLARLGLGFNPDLLTLSESGMELAALHPQAANAGRPMTAANGMR